MFNGIVVDAGSGIIGILIVILIVLAIVYFIRHL